MLISLDIVHIYENDNRIFSTKYGLGAKHFTLVLNVIQSYKGALLTNKKTDSDIVSALSKVSCLRTRNPAPAGRRNVQKFPLLVAQDG